MDWQMWEACFTLFLQEQMNGDGAHDLAHVRRVVHNAIMLARLEGARLEVVFPAAWLHDCVAVPKDSPRRSQASQLAAETAVSFLRTQPYPAQYLPSISHAIIAHSFSAGIQPQTWEAKVVQDADRLDALGAVGIARTFLVGGAMGRPLYHEDDPFCQARDPDDRVSTLDHFYTKLFRLPDTMQTAAGRREAQKRVAFMREYLAQLATEIVVSGRTPYTDNNAA